jgi:hypothetical protein
MGATGYNAQNDPRVAAEFREVSAFSRAAGLTLEPMGGFDVDYVMEERWMLPGAMQSVVDLLQREGL